MNKIKAKEILDSKKMPTVQAELETEIGIFKSSVPSGVSTGKYEAVEMRDEDGKGISKTIESIEKVIAPVLEKENLDSQKRIDGVLINLDGTKNKLRLGANSILAVSVAVCRAIAKSKNIPLWKYISEISGESPKMPEPSFNMIEGGKHSESGLPFQEFMIIPRSSTFKENLEIGKNVYKKLREILEEKYGKNNIKLSQESAFSVPVKEVYEVLDLITETIEKSEKKENIKIAIDAAASSFYLNDNYRLGDKNFSKEELCEFYKNLIKAYPIVSIEDPFAEEDYGAWQMFNITAPQIFIFGDDLTVTNLERIKMSKEQNLCTGVIIKPNQIGTVSEAIEAAKLAKSFGWKIMVANRGGETEDDFIADLAVGVGADFIKSGAPFTKERMVKYNRLVKIEKEGKF